MPDMHDAGQHNSKLTWTSYMRDLDVRIETELSKTRQLSSSRPDAHELNILGLDNGWGMLLSAPASAESFVIKVKQAQRTAEDPRPQNVPCRCATSS